MDFVSALMARMSNVLKSDMTDSVMHTQTWIQCECSHAEDKLPDIGVVTVVHIR